jgi:sec-independent protein translocase protein TatA
MFRRAMSYVAFLNSPGEIGVILILVVLLFGASKIPQLARSLGQAKREFEKAKSEEPAQVPAQPPLGQLASAVEKPK